MIKTYTYNLGRSLKLDFDSEKDKNANIANAIAELKKQLAELANMSDDELRKIAKNQYFKFIVDLDE